jgi:diguanylate cyclase (GGDEF)-like protein
MLLARSVLTEPSKVVLPETQQILAGSVLIFMALTHFVLRRSPTGPVRAILTLTDIGIVGGAMLLVQNATSDFFLAFVAVVVFAAMSHSTVAAGAYSLAAAVAYAGVLYAHAGPAFIDDGWMIVRIAFLCGLGFFFATIAEESKRQSRRARDVEKQMQTVAVHAKALARDKYRLRALSEIGRLGLVGAAASDSDVLYEITKRVQKAVGVDRCSLVVFEKDGHTGYVAASGDDEAVEVRPLSVEEYPELQATLANGEITEVHPNRPPQLWSRISTFLPDTNSFSSFLVVPIKAGEEVFGAFYLRDRDAKRSFDDEEEDFCWAAALMTASFIRGRDLLEQLRIQSRIDGLTGLLNFQAFSDELHRLLEAPGARAAAPYTLVVADMDNLKPINDEHGHVAGNRAIVEMGQRLREALPEALAMCRYGGDEFVAVVQAPLNDTVAQLNMMLAGLSAMEWDAPFDVRSSIGVAEFPLNGSNAEALMESADQAMYLAKGSGGHRIRSASADQDQTELYDAVVQVQTRRIAPNAAEEFAEGLDALSKRTILGLQAPVVKESIANLMATVESIDPHSARHSEQVAKLSRSLAERVRMTGERALMVEIAGFLHDLGKIKLPPELLTKDGALDPDERAMVQTAPEQGARILAELPGLGQVAAVVQTCQERWDGSGYPRGLRGEEIPLAAQIVGICDVYNALTSPRAQRPAMEPHRARRMLEQGIGTHWNPRLAREFLDMLSEAEAEAEQGNESSASSAPSRLTGTG